MDPHTGNSSFTAIANFQTHPSPSVENTDEKTVVNASAEHTPSAKSEISTPLGSQTPQQESILDGEWKAGRKEWMIIIVIATVSLMVALDATILVPILPAIASDLHGNTTDTFWTGTAYLLTQSVFQPFLVSLSDIFGRRSFYLISLAFFTAGTLLCCLAKDFTELLAGRSIQGIGGGGLVSLGLVIVTDIIPLRQRPVFLGVSQLSWALGTISGPLIGGLFAQHTSWRWVFYINFPFCCIGFMTVPLVMKLRANRTSIKERFLFYVDWIGGFLFVSSTCSFLIGITWGGSEYPWSSWRTLVPIIVGSVGVVATTVWELYGTSKPFLRLELFNSYSALGSYAGAVLQGLLMFCELYYIPFYFETVKDYSPTLTGVALMPLTGTAMPACILAGRLMTRSGRYRWAIWLGWAVTIAGSGLLILLDVDVRVYVWVLLLVVVGLGHGLILISLNFSAQAMAKTQDVGYAAAMYTFTRTFGMCIGVAVGGVVFQNEFKKHLGELQLPTQVADDAEGFMVDLKALPRNSSEYQAYILAYANALKVVFEILTAVAGLGAILSLLIKEYTMDKKLDSEHVLRREKAVIPEAKEETNEVDAID